MILFLLNESTPIGPKVPAGFPWHVAPELLNKLEATVEIPVHYVHIVRNPYDNIATMARRSKSSVDEHVEPYLRRVAACAAARERTDPVRWFGGSHEELIATPEPFLERLAVFLGLAPEPDWIDACIGVVFESPRRSRDRVEWPEAVRREVATRAANHVQLVSYSFDD